jgi:hypothetical protein
MYAGSFLWQLKIMKNSISDAVLVLGRYRTTPKRYQRGSFHTTVTELDTVPTRKPVRITELNHSMYLAENSYVMDVS